MIEEIKFDDVIFKTQELTGITYKEFLESRGISYTEIENDKRILFDLYGHVYLDRYDYINPETKKIIHIYEYILTSSTMEDGDDFHCYIAATSSDKEIDVGKLYDILSDPSPITILRRKTKLNKEGFAERYDIPKELFEKWEK